MIHVTLLLGDCSPPRLLDEVNLPTVPLPQEYIGYSGRSYQVVERSWRIEGDKKIKRMGCGLLLTQISGPPHVVTGTA